MAQNCEECTMYKICEKECNKFLYIKMVQSLPITPCENTSRIAFTASQ